MPVNATNKGPAIGTKSLATSTKNLVMSTKLPFQACIYSRGMALDAICEKAVHILRVNNLTKEARILEARLSTTKPNHPACVAIIEQAGITVR